MFRGIVWVFHTIFRFGTKRFSGNFAFCKSAALTSSSQAHPTFPILLLLLPPLNVPADRDCTEMRFSRPNCNDLDVSYMKEITIAIGNCAIRAVLEWTRIRKPESVSCNFPRCPLKISGKLRLLNNGNYSSNENQQKSAKSCRQFLVCAIKLAPSRPVWYINR